MIRCPNCFLPVEGQPPNWQCPLCTNRLDPRSADVGCTCIVMAGARTTGKSIYIAVLVKQLEHYAVLRNMDMRPATAGTRATFDEVYVRPLYEERGLMPPTPPQSTTKDAYQRDPLVFVLTAPDGRRHHLVIRDVAGEELEKPDELDTEALGFFARADAVFFLFDPLKVDAVRAQLRDLLPEHLVGGDPRDVLESTLRLIGDGAPRLSVILSKFDALQALRHIEGGGEWSRIMANRGAAFFRDFGPTFNPGAADGEQLHEEVRSLLVKLNAGPLLATIERAARYDPTRHRYFAVSALGNPPSGQRQHTRGIAPFRCLDPLRWVLAGTGLM